MIEVLEDTFLALQGSSWETATVCAQASDELDPDIDEGVLVAATDEAVVLSCHHAARTDCFATTAVAAAVEYQGYLVSSR